jgi:hypothetical protein
MRPSKRCDRCGAAYYQHPKLSRSQWASVKYCSIACANKARATHGQSHTRLYKVWAGIKDRCLNPNDPLYAYYGARGIPICDEWRDDFAAFASYVGPDPGPKYDLGRIDNNLGYQPGNVEWQTRTKNARNKRTTRWVTIGDKRCCLKEFCITLGLPYKKMHRRLKSGWSLARALQL